MDAPIFVFDRGLKFHISCTHFNRYTVIESFRGRKNFGPKSPEIAPKSDAPDIAQHPKERRRSPQALPSDGVPRRARLRAFLTRFRTEKFSKFFAAAKISVRNRARSRRNPMRPTPPGLRRSRTGPQKLWRALTSRRVLF